MENVSIKVEGNLMIVTVDLSRKGQPSASGKSLVIASTKGNKRIAKDSDIFIGLNVYKQR